MKRLLIAFAAVGLLGSGAASACQLTAWTGGSSNADTGGRGESLSLPTVSGSCSMRTTSGYVQDNLPSNETRMISRFYFLPTAAASATLFTAFADDAATTPLYSVLLSSGELSVDVDGDGAADVGPFTINPGVWNTVEVDWQSGTSLDVWVNANSAADPATAGTSTGVSGGSVEAARLGAMNPTGSEEIVFDDYEARRTTAIGSLLAGDADGNGSRSLGDAVSILNAFLSNQARDGIIDTNLDGTVSLGDAVLALNLFLTGS